MTATTNVKDRVKSRNSSVRSASLTPRSVSNVHEDRPTPRPLRIGYLGPTSFSATFASHQSGEIEDAEIGRSPDLVCADRVHDGADILSRLAHVLPLLATMPEHLHFLWDVGIVSASVLTMWHRELSQRLIPSRARESREAFKILSEEVWRNTRQSDSPRRYSTMQEWASSTSGTRLRWEVVGILFAIIGLRAFPCNAWDEVRQFDPERFPSCHSLLEEMRHGIEACSAFCAECEVLDEGYLTFLVVQGLFLGLERGDTNFTAWRQHGVVCDTIVAMGLHRSKNLEPDIPLWCREMRRQLVGIAYCRDTTYSYCLGRPPRLLSRFCDIDLPLALSTEDLAEGGCRLDSAVSALDEDGWDVHGKAHRTTWLRVRIMYCRIREEILEIALGRDHEVVVLSRAEQVRTSLESLVENFPDWIQAALTDVVEQLQKRRQAIQLRGEIAQSSEISLLSLHVSLLQTEFLLERALVDRGLRRREDLIPVVSHILDAVLVAVSSTDLFKGYHSDAASVLTSHGIPSAGVLAVELLKEKQTGVVTVSQVPGRKSDAIQKLSRLVAALASVQSEGANRKICHQYATILGRLLDGILENNDGPLWSSPVTATEAESRLEFPTMYDAEFLQWLDGLGHL